MKSLADKLSYALAILALAVGILAYPFRKLCDFYRKYDT